MPEPYDTLVGNPGHEIHREMPAVYETEDAIPRMRPCQRCFAVNKRSPVAPSVDTGGQRLQVTASRDHLGMVDALGVVEPRLQSDLGGRHDQNRSTDGRLTKADTDGTVLQAPLIPRVVRRKDNAEFAAILSKTEGRDRILAKTDFSQQTGEFQVLTEPNSAVYGSQNRRLVFEALRIQTASTHPPSEGGQRRVPTRRGIFLDHVAASISIVLGRPRACGC